MHHSQDDLKGRFLSVIRNSDSVFKNFECTLNSLGSFTTHHEVLYGNHILPTDSGAQAS